jgi:6,7-dimethyl-8-ribityllumazine synthase
VADDLKAEDRVEPELDGRGLRIGIAASRFNDHVTRRLFEGVRRGLAGTGVAEADITEVWVPGAFELPAAANGLIRSGRIDAVVCIGCVIRGETFHIQLVAVTTGFPVLFGVVTVDTLEQALARSEPAGGHNVGEEAALGAVEMARLLQGLRPA